MATYYVRPDGNNTNAGTGPATNQAWATITKAVQTIVGLNATGGDTVYVAPGFYPEMVTMINQPSTLVNNIIGDTLAEYFTDLSPGEVIISGSSSLHGQAIRNYAVDGDNYQGWTFTNFTMYPGTLATYSNLGTSCNLIGCKVVGELSSFSSSSNACFSCDFIACTLSQVSYTQFQRCLFRILVGITSKTIFYGSFINLADYPAHTVSAAFGFYNCIINCYPSSTTGMLITADTGGTTVYIRANRINGVGSFFKCTYSIAHYITENNVSNLDLFYDNGNNASSSTVIKYNTFQACKKCIEASNASYVLASTKTTYNNFVRCDSIIDDYVTLDSTCVQAYGGRVTGTGGSSGITAFRLPYESELYNMLITTANPITGYTKSLKFRGTAGFYGVQVYWVPVVAEVQRTVTFKYKASLASTTVSTFVLGIFNAIEVTSTQSSTAEETITLNYTSPFTGYAPLIIYARGATNTSGPYCVISDISWS